MISAQPVAAWDLRGRDRPMKEETMLAKPNPRTLPVEAKLAVLVISA
jgi:hypothetical protein